MLISFSDCLVTGLFDYLRSILFDGIQAEFDLTSDMKALIISVLGYAMMIYCIIFSVLANYLSPKFILALNFILWIIIPIALYFTYNLPLIIVELLIFWCGYSLVNVGNNALFTGAFYDMNFLIIGLANFFYGVGGTVCPFIYSAILKREGSTFRDPYLYYVICSVIVLILILVTPFKWSLVTVKDDASATNSNKENSTKTEDIVQEINNKEKDAANEPKAKKEGKKNKTLETFRCFTIPVFWVLLLMTVCHQQLHYMIIDWSLNYLSKAFGWEATDKGATFIQIYSIAFTLGRGLFSFIGSKFNPFTVMFILCIGNCLLSIVGFSIGEVGNYVIACIGFFVGPCYPTCLSLLVYLWGDDSYNATNMLYTFFTLFKEIVNYLIGLVNVYAGDEWGYRILCPLTVIELILLIVCYCMYRKNPNCAKQCCCSSKHSDEEKKEIEKVEEQGQVTIEMGKEEKPSTEEKKETEKTEEKGQVTIEMSKEEQPSVVNNSTTETKEV